jgi:hypothetical protein
MPTFASVRLRLHVTGPDGRQAGPVTVDVPVWTLTEVTSVHVVLSDVGVWTFEHEVFADGQPEPALVIGGLPALTTALLGPGPPYYKVTAYYGETAHWGPGTPWEVTSLPTHVWTKPALLVPQSGLTV